MQFDWFTFAAQIINFVILLFLLQRFLYAPILQAMQARETQIAARFQEVEEQAEKAHREAELFQKKRRDLDNQRTELMAEIEADAQQQHKRLLDEARADVDAVRDGWFAAIAREKALYLQTLRQRVSEQLFAIVRRALDDLANATLEEQIVTVFIQRLQQLDEQEEAELIQAIQNSQRQAVVRSAFELTGPQHDMFVALLHELSDNDLQVDFEEAPDLLCGIELQVYGHRIAWSLHDYIETLEQRLDSHFDGDSSSNVPAGIEREQLVAA